MSNKKINNDQEIHHIKFQHFNETLRLVMPQQQVFVQQPFQLSKDDFTILSSTDIFKKFLIPLIFFLFSIFIEIISRSIILFYKGIDISSVIQPSDNFEKWKLIAFILGLTVLIILSFLSFIIPTRRSKLIRKINVFYENNPPVLRGLTNER